MCTSINTYNRASIDRIEATDIIVVFGNDSTQFTQAAKISDGDFISRYTFEKSRINKINQNSESNNE